MTLKLLIIANNNIGTGQSGGDTIFLELIKHWQSKIDITVFGSEETNELLKRYQLTPKFIKTDKINLNSEPTISNLIYHTLRRIYRGFIAFYSNRQQFVNSSFCYTTSDFYPDFIFGLLYKLINPHGVWICGQFLFAPPPGNKYSPYRHQFIKGSLYYVVQIFSRFLAQLFADQILVTSKPDCSRFPGKKVVVIQGGVDIRESNNYLQSNKVKPINKRKYDAVFLGRLHSQKGVLELVDIWRYVVKTIPKAQLAIIGNGQLEKQLIDKINKYELSKNITMFGFQHGQDKYNIFKESKIVVHPSIYDSGGMATAEAMAWGLPGVSFDLEALKTYYPQGVIKTKNGNNQEFSQNIIKLLQNQTLYQKTSDQALKLIKTGWDWNIRSKKIYKQIFQQ